MREPLLWEFPGGKLEPGESEQECLQREVEEELGLKILPVTRLTPVVHHASHQSIELIPFICKYEGGIVALTEHRAYQWAELRELRGYDWCAPDVPIVEEYLNLKQLE